MTFITIMVAAFALGGQQASTLSCPITGEPIVKGMKVTVYNGASFTYCCPGCDKQFEKDPKAALAKAGKDGKTIGVFLFDAISKKPIVESEAKGGSSDFKGLRFYFANTKGKATFDMEPMKYASLPEKEALYCPVSKEAVESYAKASGYDDYKGVRYYFCCAGCDEPFAKNPVKYSPAAKAYVKAPTAHTTAKPAKGGQG